MYSVTGIVNNSSDSAVLIPSYQDNEGLLITLCSLNNEITPINIIIVDDGSQVSVVQGVDGFQTHHNIVIITLAKNQGIVKALNTGLDFCDSSEIKYVYRLDAHDINVEGRLSKQKDVMLEKNAALVGGAVEFFDENGKTISVLHLPQSSNEIKKLQIFRSCFVHPAVMLDLSKLGDLYRYSNDYIHAEDYELFMRITRSFHVENIHDVVTKCLIRQGGISLSNRSHQIKSVMKAQIKYFDFNSKYSYLGVLKTTVLYLFPRNVVEFIKIKILKVHR